MNKKLYPYLKKEFALVCRFNESIIYPLNAETDNQYTSPSYTYNTINRTAAEILLLCDGKHTIDNIVFELSEKFNDDQKNVEPVVQEFLNECLNRGHIMYSKELNFQNINVNGDFSIITPINACFEITKECPLRCRHCFNESGTAKLKEMTESQVKEVIDKLSDMGVQKLMLTGGEPLARPDFLNIVGYAYSRFVAISIASNGYLMTEQMAQDLSAYRNKIVVQISLDGVKEHHDKIRGIQGSYDRVLDAISYLRKYGVAVTVASTLNGENFDDMEAIAFTAHKYGALQLTYAITMNQGRARENKLAYSVDVNELIKRASKLKKKYMDKGLFIQVDDDTLVKIHEQDNRNTCGAGLSQIAIRENGDVSPCLSFFYTYGNILYDIPQNIFTPERAAFFKKLQIPCEEYCGDCEELNNCLHCFARAYGSEKENCKWKMDFDILTKTDGGQNAEIYKCYKEI